MSLNKKKICWALAFFPLCLNAADYEQVAPALPEQEEVVVPVLSQLHEVNDLGDDSRVLGHLKGMVLVSSHQQVVDAGRDAKGVVLELDPEDLVPGLAEHLQASLGSSISLRSLNRLNQGILKLYRDNDRPVSEVYAAGNQDISNGVVQIVVLLGRLGEVKLEGAQYFDADSLREYISQVPGQPISMRALQRDLRGLNSNPFRSATVAVRRGTTFKAADLAVQIKDRWPWRFYTGVEDTGTQQVGKRRGFVGFNWGNVAGLDHVLGYQYTSASNAKHYDAHSLSYRIPVKKLGHDLQLFGSYSEADSDPANFINIKAENVQLGARYNMPLSQSGKGNQVWSLGFDYKRSNNNLSFGGAQVRSNAVEVGQFIAAYAVNFSHRNLQHEVKGSWLFSPGELFGDNDDRAFAASNQGADAQYQYWTLSYKLLAALPGGWQWRLSADVQYTEDTLLSSEQLGLGGYATLRGYDEFSAIAERGGIFRQELFTPAFKPLSEFVSQQDELRFLLFIDQGSVSQANGAGSTALASAGLGLRYQLGSHLSARIDYGWQSKALPGRSRDDRLHFKVTASY